MKRMKAEPVTEQWASLQRDPLLTVRAIHAALHVDVHTVRRWIKEKRLRAVRVGGRLLIRQSQVLNLLQEVE
jgi:excisionase family DNA binding protein